MEVIRTYCLVTKTGSTQTSTIEFRDSNNDLLQCNYVHVTASGGAVGQERNQQVKISFDAPGLSTPLANQSSIANDIGQTSGMTSQIIGTPYIVPEREFIFSDKDRVSSVKIETLNTSNVLLMFDYGQVQSASTMRANFRPIGK